MVSGFLVKGKDGQNSSNGIIDSRENNMEAKGMIDSPIISSTLNFSVVERLGSGVNFNVNNNFNAAYNIHLFIF